MVWSKSAGGYVERHAFAHGANIGNHFHLRDGYAKVPDGRDDYFPGDVGCADGSGAVSLHEAQGIGDFWWGLTTLYILAKSATGFDMRLLIEFVRKWMGEGNL